jgi:ribosome-binding protein aMBF1 (putative translation factor)
MTMAKEETAMATAQRRPPRPADPPPRKTKRHKELPVAQQEVARRVSMKLKEVGLLQTELARVAGVARDVIHKAVIRGSVPRDQRDRDAVAKMLNVSSSWLWFGGADGEGKGELLTTAGFRPDPKAYHIVVQDEGFVPLAYPGDVLYVTPSYPPRIGDRIYMKYRGGEGVFRLLSTEEDNITVASSGGGRMTLRRSETDELHKIAGVIYT